MNMYLRQISVAVALTAACSGIVQSGAVQNVPFKTSAGASAVPRSSHLAKITVLHESGARPRFSPDGSQLVFDRQNADGFYDVYLSDLSGRVIRSLSEGRAGVPQRHNGNARFHPSGRHVVFVSEEEEHFGVSMKYLADPGIGTFSNFRATPPDAGMVSRLTNTPIKKSLADKTFAFGVVNPVFSPDGRTFVWTERYAQGGNHNWGKWRLKSAAWETSGDGPVLRNEKVIYTPTKGTYATAMAYIGSDRLLFAGNPDGQHEYGMDLYVLDLGSGRIQKITDTPDVWEEGACVAPNGQIVYMTNMASKDKLDFKNANWAAQRVERDYYLTDSSGREHERLTFFNDPSAPEFAGRLITAACDISSDGRYLAGTIGVDEGQGTRADVKLKTVLAEFRRPLR
jgi:Tol biopolymer transport system component